MLEKKGWRPGYSSSNWLKQKPLEALKILRFFKQLQVLMGTVRYTVENFGTSHNDTTGDKGGGHRCTVKWITCGGKPLSPRKAGNMV